MYVKRGEDKMFGYSFDDFLVRGIVYSLLGIPIILTILNFYNLFTKKKFKENIVDGLIMTLGPILSVFLLSIEIGPDYYEALEINSNIEWHTPIASWHMPTIIIVSLLGIIGYMVLRKIKFKLPPLIIVMCISCMYIGSILGIGWITQLSEHFFDRGNDKLYLIIYLCIFPINYIICCISLILKVINEYTTGDERKEYSSVFLNNCNLLLQNSRNWWIIAVILMLPILLVTLIVLILFGQQPTAIIKAFTETSDWFFSEKVSPPPIEHSGHYLCTVALRGHINIVKPLRLGVRNKEKIVVNRQLCVANAFEDLVKERMPLLHMFIRRKYDKYGYPLSRHINSQTQADIIYLIMKPLEWMFVIVLYVFDIQPEDRIARQYLPLN